jgi:hypothetical protein
LQHRGAVARPKIQQRVLVGGDQVIELADVHLGELTSGDHTHGGES